MGRALPDDEAIEAKMVTKAIERAQTTVEQRNGEIRKNVLKYDEVMNEQRKVIYRRRDQILEGADLKIGGDGVPRRGGRRAHRDALRQRRHRRMGSRRAGQGAEDVLAERHHRGVSSRSATRPTRCTTSSCPTRRRTTRSAKPS